MARVGATVHVGAMVGEGAGRAKDGPVMVPM